MEDDDAPASRGADRAEEAVDLMAQPVRLLQIYGIEDCMRCCNDCLRKRQLTSQ